MPKRKARTVEERAGRILSKARRHASTARKGWENDLEDVAVTFLFQPFENAVIAATAVARMVKAPTHWQRSEQATELVEQGFLITDVSDRLDTLNRDRKRAAYGYDDEDDEDLDFEESSQAISEYLDEVEALIKRGGKKIKDV